MRRWGWPATILFGVISLALLALFVWPPPTLAECAEVSGRVSDVQYDTVISNRRSHEHIKFRLEGNERYYTYTDDDPLYVRVKVNIREGVSARIWFKEPPTFIFPLYTKELWRIDVDDRTVVDHDTLAADAGRAKGGIALTGVLFFGLLTFVTLRATLRANSRR